jgi:nucleoside-diphosphate-sugar epimerase
MKSALVTGCAGFIASHLTEKLLLNNWNIIGLDNFHPYYDKQLKLKNLEKFKDHKNFKFVQGSILDTDILKTFSNLNTVFHLAAIAGVRSSFETPDEYFKINIKGTQNILKTFQNVDELIFASSSSVYGEVKPNEFPVKENHLLNPISPYGESKKQSELLCQDYSEKLKIKTSILRFYTVYGPRQRPDEAIMKFITSAILGKSIPIFGDGRKIRDYTYVSDIVDGIISSQKFGNGIYNLGSGKPISLNDMVDIIEKKLDKKIKRQYVDSPKGDVFKTHADITKSKNELKFLPKMNFEDGIEQTINWCKNFSLYDNLK